MRGKPVDVSTIPKAIEAGLAYVTEDRKQLGLVLIDNIMHNTTLANLNGVSKAAMIDNHQEDQGRLRLPLSGCASARTRSTRKRSIFRAATSRRWCCRSGCSPIRRC
jgi:hypothetical protein